MLFHSFEFLILLSITVLVYYIFPKSRVYALAWANLLFYGASGFNYLVLFGIVTFISYFLALKLHESKNNLYYYLGLGLNLLNLLFFKYSGFLLSNLTSLLNIGFQNQDEFISRIILPVGISFYTFQIIAYMTDVKRDEIEPERSFIRFWVFISFFGQLIAGPIMRGYQFLPQINDVKSCIWKESRLKYGIYYIMMGLSKKLLFADYLATYANRFFDSYMNFTMLDGWIAAWLFAFQIYFDFSAYSEIAVGVGHLFDLDLDINFKSPYISRSPKEFWKRWHITLSSWIRDYIYIPLGGNKNGFVMQCMFLMTAMTLSGMWHGAAWTFIVWGAYHGLLVIFHNIYLRYFSDFRNKLKDKKWYNALSVFVFFNLTSIGWVFFRAKSFSQAIQIIGKMFNAGNLTITSFQVKYLVIVAGLCLMHVVEYLVRKNEQEIAGKIQKHVPVPLRALGYTVMVLALLVIAQTEQSTFIYFQF
ncbi:D-alanyl-lipoteichoic acid acyltransferase DltB, MBOAT superfamily [Dethiosulfatibacter aminovorans DSM 17477]|uniref:D-alanyl-lipoteichoic acid acyltransferase DltB, MBOAT superfamily n=1 Tax=Dethiosulfatibacter aminovorans DSM 17477 TaxID=1121476 RepID=A0A1M6FVD6_9FIRM|nr:MBOAT family O-acyltransferase [Dethiosulfatibacter aminovorans]SHJ01600.1 D-alanyl-lipoteichoic acid acyltransferase DltB, MBOAT superfamily [Dethiosulfatibacter aminovorans DSM 17477]